jgi:6-phosphogluconolactonase
MSKELYFYIGTYTEPILFGTGEVMPGKGEGIYLFRFDQNSGTLVLRDVFTGIRNPSYLAVSPSVRNLYCVNELKDYGGEKSGSVSAFSIEKKTGRLSALNTVSSRGGDPCFICVDKNEKYAFVSNFMTGSVAAFPLRADGFLGNASCVVQHYGHGVHPSRQKGPHAHSVVLDKTENTALVPDLGIDKIVPYKIDYDKGALLDDVYPGIETAAGSGPRHCVFNSTGDMFYAINELSLVLTAYEYDAATCSVRQVQSIVSAPKTGENVIGADIDIHPGGKFLYASIRGLDVIAAFGIDAKGLLYLVDRQPSAGKTPRNFAIDPSGRWLLVGNQDSDTVAVFAIDETSGSLSKVSAVKVPAPVCIKAIWL